MIVIVSALEYELNNAVANTVTNPRVSFFWFKREVRSLGQYNVWGFWCDYGGRALDIELFHISELKFINYYQLYQTLRADILPNTYLIILI